MKYPPVNCSLLMEAKELYISWHGYRTQVETLKLFLFWAIYISAKSITANQTCKLFGISLVIILKYLCNIINNNTYILRFTKCAIM